MVLQEIETLLCNPSIAPVESKTEYLQDSWLVSCSEWLNEIVWLFADVVIVFIVTFGFVKSNPIVWLNNAQAEFPIVSLHQTFHK